MQPYQSQQAHLNLNGGNPSESRVPSIGICERITGNG